MWLFIHQLCYDTYHLLLKINSSQSSQNQIEVFSLIPVCKSSVFEVNGQYWWLSCILVKIEQCLKTCPLQLFSEICHFPDSYKKAHWVEITPSMPLDGHVKTGLKPPIIDSYIYETEWFHFSMNNLKIHEKCSEYGTILLI